MSKWELGESVEMLVLRSEVTEALDGEVTETCGSEEGVEGSSGGVSTSDSDGAWSEMDDAGAGACSEFI